MLRKKGTRVRDAEEKLEDLVKNEAPEEDGAARLRALRRFGIIVFVLSPCEKSATQVCLLFTRRIEITL